MVADISLILDIIMDFIKLFVESYVALVHYVAWPTVTLLALYLFRKDLRLLMGRIRKVERSGLEFYKQGETEKITAPDVLATTEIPTDLSKEAKRIIATLWNRQTYHFKDDFSRRWSFRVLPHSEAYGSFMLGFAELLRSGFVTWTRKDGQAVLTDKGIEYVNKNPELKKTDDIYRF